MATTMSPLTTQELHHFHKTDRQLFCFLIFKLGREITQSLLVMSLWLWLEHIGYPNLIHTIMKLQNQPYLVEAVFEEAAACIIMCLDGDGDDGGSLVLMKMLIQRDISVRIFHERRYTVLAGIKSILKNICNRIFFDILHDNKNILLKSKKRLNNNSLSGFPHPFFGDIINMVMRAPPNETAAEASSKIWDGKKPSDDVCKEDRTMFLTFSRGYPVTEKEVRELFGDESVESVNMGGGGGGGSQKLYAVMVLKEVASVDRILNGKKTAKLHIKGKHIWTRKYQFHSTCT